MISRADCRGAHLRVLLLASTALICSSLAAQAQTWTGATSPDWFDGTNWNTATVPVGGDAPTIDTTTPNAPVIDGATAPAAGAFPQIFIGESATGTLTIQNAGILNADRGFIGTIAGSNGTVTMTGAGSIWNSTDTSNGIVVGVDGTGTFNLTTGSTVNSANTIVGLGATSNGSVTVDGATWNQTGAAPLSALFVGYGGTGSFTVQNGGTAATVNTYVGHLAGSVGTATVTDGGSTWTSSESIFVGNRGTGTFNVLNGGAVTTTQDTVLGFAAGSTGTINVDGGTSAWTARDIVVGGNSFAQPGGTGIFNVSNAGTVTVNRDTFISASAGGVGTVTVKDNLSSWTSTGDIYIGLVTSGTFNVQNGATVTANKDTYVGGLSGATGTLNVDGTGSIWTNATPNQAMIVGGNNFGPTPGGAGIVNITNGGQIASDFTFIGYSAGATGNVTVTGANSTWTMNNDSVIGGNDGSIPSGGTGVFNVLNGGALVTAGDLYLGNSLDGAANGTLNLNGATTTWTGNFVLVGAAGTGTINITGGAVANVGGVIIGDCLCAIGTVNVSGANSEFNTTGIVIGNDGTGTLNVSNGGTATSAGDVYLGAGFGSGTLNINSGGSFTTSGNLILGLGNNATVTVSDIGSVLNVGLATFIGNAGGVGSSAVNVLNGATANLGSIFLGFSSAGMLTVDATSQVNGTNYAQDVTGTFAVGISPTQNGKVTIADGGFGSIDLTTAGALVVNAKTTLAKTYTVMTAENPIAGNFSSVTVVGNANNLRVNYNVDCGVGCFAVQLSVDTFILSNLLPPGTGRNPVNVAAGLDRAIASGVTIPDQFFDVFALSGSSLVNALSQLSGEAANGGAIASRQLTNSFLSLLLNPFGGAPGGNSGALGFARGFGAGEQALSPEAAAAYAAVTPRDQRLDSPAQRWRVWGQAYGGGNRTEGEAAAGTHDTRAQTYGLATGFDYRLSTDTMVGFALAGGGTSWNLAQGLGRGSSDAFQVGAYAIKSFGAGYISGALAYGLFNTSTNRTVTLAGADALTARFDAHNISGRIETGYRYPLAKFAVTPYAAVQVQNYWTPSYTEAANSGSGVFALSFNSRSTVASRTELGAWFDKTVALRRGDTLTLRARVAWANDQSNGPSLNAVFQSLPAAGFVVEGAAPAKNLALLTGGAELRLTSHVSVGARFDGEFAPRSQTYAGTGTVRYSW